MERRPAFASDVTSANQDVNSSAVTLTLIDESGKEHSISVPTDAVTKTVVEQSNPNALLRFANPASSERTESFELSISGDSINRAMTRASAGLNGEKWDPSISIKANISITYDYYAYQTGDRCLLKSVSGSWHVSDYTVSLSNRKLSYACIDPNNQNQIGYQTPIANTFSYKTNFTTYIFNRVAGVLAANSQVTLKHGTSSIWTLRVDAELFNTMISSSWS